MIVMIRHYILSVIVIIVVIVILLVFYPLKDEGIDYSCNSDEDCVIKNIGNQCGYYPACVNRNFIPDPPELDSVICGFPDIDRCECIENMCVNVQLDSLE
jgi:hypothetical protein